MNTTGPTSTAVSGDTLRPAPQLKTLYFIYLMSLAFICVIVPAIFIVLAEEMIVAEIYIVSLLVPVAFIAWWIPLYYRTMVYNLTTTEISWRRGVWFRQTGIVPYNRITNIDIIQGPLMRYFRISSLRIQTAGYSAQAMAELRLHGIEQPEGVRDWILGYVRGSFPVATETLTRPEAGDAATQMLTELREIRKLLERGR